MQMYTQAPNTTEQFPQMEFVQPQTLMFNAPMTQPLTFVGQTIVPSLGLTQQMVIPQWPQQALTNNPQTLPSVPVTTTVLVYNEHTQELEPLEPSLAPALLDTVTNTLVPIPGWSFVDMETFKSLTPTPSETEEVVAAVFDEEVADFLKDPEPVQEQVSSVEEPELKVEKSKETVEKPEAEENKTKKSKKQTAEKIHRSKQVLIEQVHGEIKETYEAKGLYASDDEVLRGHDTVRVHVKTQEGLKKIQGVLSDVENHPKVDLCRIATPISMKNKFQKKGFIVYLKVLEEYQVPVVQSIVMSVLKDDNTSVYKKCEVALAKEEQLPKAVEQVAEEPKPFFDVVDLFDISPPRMIPNTSNASLAA